MKVNVISNINELSQLKEQWNKLFNDGGYSAFQSYEYIYSSALTNGSNLFVITLLDDGVLKEIWPFEIIKNKLRFINDSHADFCDILSNSNSYEVVNYLVEYKLIDTLKLKNMKNDSLVLSKLKNVEVLRNFKCTNYSKLQLDQTDNFPSNFTGFVYRQKRRLKRILKKYSAKHSILSCDEASFPINDIQVLREKMISTSVRDSKYLNEDFLIIVKALYESKKMIVSKLELDKRIVAISFIFKDKNDYSFWIDMYDDLKMINLYHNTIFIKYITNLSSATFNFGRGIYNYKIQNFAPEPRDLVELNTFRNKLEKIIFECKELMSNYILKNRFGVYIFKTLSRFI